MSRRVFVVALVVGLPALVLVSRLVQGSQSTPVQVQRIASSDLSSSILASGNLVYRDSVELRPQLIGQVVAAEVKEGDHVAAGQVVIRLDPSLYDAAVKQHAAAVRQQAALLESQRVTLASDERSFGRTQKLFDQRLIGLDAYERARSDLEAKRFALKSQDSALAQAEAELKQAREDLGKTVIRSPMDGVVTRMSARVGETVVAGTNIPGSSLMEIADPSQVLAEVNVDETDINDMHVRQPADVHAMALPGLTLKATVGFIGASADTESNQQGHMFKVRLLLANAKDMRVRPGMSCRAEIFTRRKSGVVAAPVAAVLYDHANTAGRTDTQAAGEGAYVMVVNHGTAEKRAITTGISTDTQLEVITGLHAGDEVVTGPYLALHHLRSGEAVAPGAPVGEGDAGP